MSAPSPRPSAFLGIGNDLLGKLSVAFSALTMDIVKNDRFTKTGRFRQAHIAWNYTLKDLCPEETAQIRGYLAGEAGSFIVHRQQDAFNFQAWTEGAPDAHESIQEFGDAFEGQILALNGNEHGIGGYKRVQSEEIQGWRAIQYDELILLIERL